MMDSGAEKSSSLIVRRRSNGSLKIGGALESPEANERGWHIAKPVRRTLEHQEGLLKHSGTLVYEVIGKPDLARVLSAIVDLMDTGHGFRLLRLIRISDMRQIVFDMNGFDYP